MEANAREIVRLGWARRLGLDDEALSGTEPGAEPVRVVSADTVMVLRLWDLAVVVGPDWLHARTAGRDPIELSDHTTLLRCCDDYPARLLGQSVLAYTDTYVVAPGLSDVPAADDPEVVGSLERACPPDDVTDRVPPRWGSAGCSRRWSSWTTTTPRWRGRAMRSGRGCWVTSGC